jgi:hemolysin activation/secretion protein
MRKKSTAALELRAVLLCLGAAFWMPHPALGQAPAAPEAASASAETFDIWEFRVEGNTTLNPQVIEKTVYPFLGPKRGLEDVEQARAALEQVYRESGYSAALVDVPEQDVNEGVVIIKVGEGKVDRLKVTGSRYFSLGAIKDKVPALAEGKPLHLPTAQEQLAELAGENADRSVTPIMRAGRTPGTVEVDLNVKDELPLHGSLEMNGRNSANTTRSRLAASLRYDNLWQSQHSASLQYQVSPEDYNNLEVWAGTYVMPLDFIGAKLAFYGVGLSSTSNIATLGALNVVGVGEIYGLRLVKPLPGGKGYNHSLTLGWDYKDFGQTVSLLGTDVSNTPIQYSPFSLSYNGGLNYSDGSLSSFNLEANFNIRGLGNDRLQFENKRAGARADYLYLQGDFKHRQVLPFDMALQARFSGQVSDSPLISNEQFSAGGWQTVRGYHETERLGDDGVNGSLELYSPELKEYTFEGMNHLRILAFSDAAKLWVQRALPGTPHVYNLLSAGMGLRMQMFKHVLGEFDWAYPLVATNTVNIGAQRIDFRLAYEF